MSYPDIDQRHANSILTRLQNGVPPEPADIPYIRVGRETEEHRLCSKKTEGLSVVSDNAGELFFILGEFGHGKSFFINLLAHQSAERNFIRSEFDIQDIEDLSNKASLYTGVVSNIEYPDYQGNGLIPLLRQFCKKCDLDDLNDIASRYGMFGHPIHKMLKSLLKAWSNGSIYVDRDETRLSKIEVLSAVAGYLTGKEIGLPEKHAIGKKGVGTIRKESDDLYEYLRHIRSLALALEYDGFIILIDEAAEQLSWNSDTNTTQRLIDLYNRCYTNGEFERMMFAFVGNEDKWEGLINETGHQALSDRYHAKKIILGDLEYSDYVELTKRVGKLVEVADSTDRQLTNDESERIVDQAVEIHGGVDALSPRRLLVFPKGREENETLVDLLRDQLN